SASSSRSSCSSSRAPSDGTQRCPLRGQRATPAAWTTAARVALESWGTRASPATRIENASRNTRKSPKRKRATPLSEGSPALARVSADSSRLTSHDALDGHALAGLGVGHLVALHLLAVHRQLGRARLAAVLHVDRVGRPAGLPHDRELRHVLGQARLDDKAVPLRTHPEEVLRHRHEVPGRRPREPAVLRLAGLDRVLAGDHLAVDVGLRAVNLAHVLEVGRADLRVVLPGALRATDHRLGDHDPGAVVAEDARVLLVHGGIRRDLTVLAVVLRQRGVAQHDLPFAVEALLDRVERLPRLAGLHTDPAHDAEALGLDEDLALFVLLGPDLPAEEVVGAQEPLAVPAVLEHDLLHLRHFLADALGL